MTGIMATDNTPPLPPEPRPRYVWPWFALGAVVLAVLLAVLWMSKEVERMRRIRDANAPPPETQRAEPAPQQK